MTTIRSSNSTDIAKQFADETADRYAAAFTETADAVRLAVTDDAITTDMPDAD